MDRTHNNSWRDITKYCDNTLASLELRKGHCHNTFLLDKAWSSIQIFLHTKFHSKNFLLQPAGWVWGLLNSLESGKVYEATEVEDNIQMEDICTFISMHFHKTFSMPLWFCSAHSKTASKSNSEALFSNWYETLLWRC